MINRGELGAWLRLLETPGLGRQSARKLLAAFGSPEAAISAGASARRQVIGPIPSSALDTLPDALPALLDTTLEWLDAEVPEPRAVIAIGDPRYPHALLESPDPPLLLYVRGRIELLQADAIAIVGTRNPTPQGADNARAFAAHLSHAGLTVVSGLALGVDAAAHEGGLQGAASTIAVVGTGADIVYPRRNLALAQRIAAEGLIVSEYALGTPSMAPNFPRRNRIIAGLGRGTLVVEAALKSGSLITARLANEAGRDVFAIPGSIHSPQARGCHALIKQGAKLVESAADIFDDLRPASAAPRAVQADNAPHADAPLLDALGFDPVTLDALVARTGWGAAELTARLFTLELDGLVARLAGQLFQRLPAR